MITSFKVFASVLPLAKIANGVNLKEYVSYVYSEDNSPKALLSTDTPLTFTPLSQKPFSTFTGKTWYLIKFDDSKNSNHDWFIQSFIPSCKKIF